MKLSKLDIVVISISILCIVSVGVAGLFNILSYQSPQVAYLYPAFGGVQNVWMTDVEAPDNQHQLTFSEYGVFDYDISDDARWLAFADKDSDSATRIRLLDIPNDHLIELVDCVALTAYCTTPVFSPDGTKLAYQRSESINGQYGLSRIWLVDLTNPEYETHPLLADTHVVGYSSVWSQDNNTLAFYSADEHESGILVYDFVPRGNDDVQLRFIPSAHGSMGTVSPNGQVIIFPEIVRRGDRFYTHLRIADLLNKDFAVFTDPEGATDDVVAQWSPDGQTVALARQYTDDRWTQGHQLYLRDVSSDNLTPIAYDERYNTSYFRWNSTGTRLVLQRFPLQNTDGTAIVDARPEVWMVDLETGGLTQVLENAFLPQWASP